jgi:hypothetical protein
MGRRYINLLEPWFKTKTGVVSPGFHRRVTGRFVSDLCTPVALLLAEWALATRVRRLAHLVSNAAHVRVVRREFATLAAAVDTIAGWHPIGETAVVAKRVDRESSHHVHTYAMGPRVYKSSCTMVQENK